jgi:hypothetical protein
MAQDDSRREPTLKILTTVPSNAEAVMVVGELDAAGIRAMPRSSTQAMGPWGTAGPRDIYVEAYDLDRAREVLSTKAMSEDELIQAEEEAATQPTQHQGKDKDGGP